MGGPEAGPLGKAARLEGVRVGVDVDCGTLALDSTLSPIRFACVGSKVELVCKGLVYAQLGIRVPGSMDTTAMG